MLDLSLTFIKYGLLCFGGGYMLVPLITGDLVGDGRVLSVEQFGNLLSIAQLTPGPVGINTATYVGFVENGFVGALLCTLSLVLPSLVLGGTAISLLKRFSEKFLVKGLLSGARLGSCALLVYAVLIFANIAIWTPSLPSDVFYRCWQHLPLRDQWHWSWTGIMVMLAAFSVSQWAKIPAAAVIIGSGILGGILFPYFG